MPRRRVLRKDQFDTTAEPSYVDHPRAQLLFSARSALRFDCFALPTFTSSRAKHVHSENFGPQMHEIRSTIPVLGVELDLVPSPNKSGGR